MKNVVILGASGFVGYELYNMCKVHPNINLSALSANKSAGELVDDKELGQSLRYQTIENIDFDNVDFIFNCLPCLLYTSPSPRDRSLSRMPSSA